MNFFYYSVEFYNLFHYSIYRLIYLKCNGRTRIFKGNHKFNRQINCRIPRKLYSHNRYFFVNEHDISLVTQTNRAPFYSIKNINEQNIIDYCNIPYNVIQEQPYRIQMPEVYTKSSKTQFKETTIINLQDNLNQDCIICMDTEKTTVIIPCGHFETCSICIKTQKYCPFCRKLIKSLVHVN